MSYTEIIFSILSILNIAEKKIPLEPNWKSTNQYQKYLLDNWYSKKNDIPVSLKKESKEFVSTDPNELNKKSKEIGLYLKFGNFHENTFEALSLVNLNFELIKQGTKTNINYNNKSYPAFKLDMGFEILKSNKYEIVKLETSGSDFVYITESKKPLAGLDLIKTVMDIRETLVTAKKIEYDYLIMPVVGVDQIGGIDALHGINSTSNISNSPIILANIVQSVRIKLNESGITLKPQVNKLPSSNLSCFNISNPFILWVEREGYNLPIACCYIDQYDWKYISNISNTNNINYNDFNNTSDEGPAQAQLRNLLLQLQ